MHRLSTGFVLGYHGCDSAIAERLLRGEPFRKSENDYDWLGPGVYFWEANPRRALSFANEMRSRIPSHIRTPHVVGAVIDMGLCLDLASESGIEQVRYAYRALKDLTAAAGTDLPSNEGGADTVFRNLDCAVIQQLHDIRRLNGQPAIDTVRGIFTEGEPAYPGAGFREKTHTQICVCNAVQIKGVFRVSQYDLT